MKMDNKTTLALIELATVAILAVKDIVLKKIECNNQRLEGQHTVLLYAFYCVTFSPSRSVRCETKEPPAMRVRIEGYTKKTPNAIQ